MSRHEKAALLLAKEDLGVYGTNFKKLIKEKERQMSEAIKILDFESAAILRDEIKILLEQKKN